MCRARRGDAQAFGVLWQRHVPTLQSIVAAVLPQPAGADAVQDVIQDVALVALSKLHTLRDPRGFGAWLCVIARNRARNARKAARLQARSEEMDSLTAEQQPPRQLDTDEALAVLRSMPLTYRRPLMLRFLDGLSGPEIAARLGMTPGSVRVNLCRGLKLLRQRVIGQAEC